MRVFTEHATINGLFEGWQGRLGRDYLPYRNHVYRVFNLACSLADAEAEDIERLAVASAFHDVAIWLDGTFDYLGPSIRRANEFLATVGRESWVEVVGLMIDQHHKVSPWRGPDSRLVEAFRRADWIDVCLCALPTRLPRSFVREVVGAFPRKGFHGRLVALALWWARQHPLRPLPMFKL